MRRIRVAGDKRHPGLGLGLGFGLGFGLALGLGLRRPLGSEGEERGLTGVKVRVRVRVKG